MFRQNRFWVKLNAFDWKLSVPDPHNFMIVIAPRGNLKVRMERIWLDDEGMVSNGREGCWYAREDSFPIMAYGACFAVPDFSSSADDTLGLMTEYLVPEADTEQRKRNFAF